MSKESEHFIHIIMNYILMIKAKLNLNTFIQENELHLIVILSDAITDKDQILQLKASLIFSINAIVY